jgi:hypothetical protein
VTKAVPLFVVKTCGREPEEVFKTTLIPPLAGFNCTSVTCVVCAHAGVAAKNTKVAAPNIKLLP